MATDCIFLKKCQCLNCINSYNICPCVLMCKNWMLVKFVSKQKQDRKCENIVTK